MLAGIPWIYPWGGCQPHNQGEHKWDPWLAPRCGYVYFCTEECQSETYMLRLPDDIGLRVRKHHLQPEFISTDEDYYHLTYAKQFESLESATQTLGEWAEECNLGQDRAETMHSIDQLGTLAYLGSIPSSQIEYCQRPEKWKGPLRLADKQLQWKPLNIA